MTRQEEQEPLLIDDDVTFTRSTDVTRQKRSRVLLFLFLGVAVVVLVGGVAVGVSSNSNNKSTNQDAVVTASSSKRGKNRQEKSRDDNFRFAAVAPDARDCATIATNLFAVHQASAVDAAIATVLCNGLHNADSLGLGGGIFMNIYDTPRNGSQKEFFILDSREVAPLAASKDMFVNSSFSPSEGPLAIAVPGQIAGMWEAWKRFGRVPWRELFTPVIDMARNGMVVDKNLAGQILSKEAAIREQPSLSEIFVHPNGSLVKQGDILKRPKHARCLEVIAEEGGEALYTGSLAEELIEDLREIGSNITLEDLRLYTPVWREAIVMNLTNRVASSDPANHGARSDPTYEELTLHTMPPPGGGLVLAAILNILNGYNMTSADLGTLQDRVHTYHRIIEAFKFAYAKRTEVGDPEFVNVTQLVSELTSPEFASEIRSHLTENATHNVTYYRPEFEPITDAGTSHTSILAPDGAAVATTSTINTSFGSKRRGNRTGIIFNNQMADFSQPDDTDEWGLPPSEANFIEPGKRPTSSMSPSILTDQSGKVAAIIGASGGTRITTGVAYALIHHLWLGYRIKDAIALPRIHHQLVPNEISAETRFPQDILDGLRQLGHMVNTSSSHCVVQGISVARDLSGDGSRGHCEDEEEDEEDEPRDQYQYRWSRDECITAACDGRKDGEPDGY